MASPTHYGAWFLLVVAQAMDAAQRALASKYPDCTVEFGNDDMNHVFDEDEFTQRLEECTWFEPPDDLIRRFLTLCGGDSNQVDSWFALGQKWAGS